MNQRNVILILCYIGFISCGSDAPVFKMFLDDMEDHWKSGATYNQTKFDQLISCMKKDDEILVDSQEATWSKILGFYLKNGTDGDHWGQDGRNPHWMRQTAAYFGKD